MRNIKIRKSHESGDEMNQQENEKMENAKLCKSLSVTSWSVVEKIKSMWGL